MWKVFQCIWRIRSKNLCVHGEDAKRLLAYFQNTPRDTKLSITRLIMVQVGLDKAKNPSNATVPI
jgi:hypothetical protein